MKILSMNVHSLIEAEEEKKLLQFADMVAAELPDLIGLQEVNQTRSGPAAGYLAGVPEGLEETDDLAGVKGQGRQRVIQPAGGERESIALPSSCVGTTMRSASPPVYRSWERLTTGPGSR